MFDATAQNWLQQSLDFVCDHVDWAILDAFCSSRTAFVAPHQEILVPSQPGTPLPTTEPAMAIGISDSLATKLSQPVTFFTIACISISLVAISTVWRNKQASSHETISKRALTKPEINILDEGYSSPGEEALKRPRPQHFPSHDNTTVFSRTATLIARCSELLQVVNNTEVTQEEQAIIMSSLSAELPLSISALCQIQQLLGLYYNVLGTQSGLRSCFETVLTGLSTVVSSLDGELANLLDCDCSVRKFPAHSGDFAQFEDLMQALRNHRESLLFVLDSVQKASDFSKNASSSLALPALLDTKALTPGTDMKGFMDGPPDFDELPEYSPPADGQPMPDDSKGAPAHAVEIDSNPVAVKPNSNTAITAADLFEAVKEDDIPGLESLLKANFDPNTTHGKLQRTALHEAARLNRSACAKTLIQHGAIVDVNDSKGDIPLHLASWEGHVEVSLELLSAGAGIDRMSGRDGSTPLWCAITAHHIDLARLLLKHGARIGLKSPTDALPLHQAAITGQSAMCELLLERGAIVDCVDREMNTPLHYAATIGDLRTARVLLKEGADVNKMQERGLTPLHWACHKGHDEMVTLLLSNGAKTNAKSATFASPLHCAAARGHLDCAKVLVKKAVDCSIVTTGWDGATGTAEEIARRRGFSNLVAVIRSARSTKK
jgi:ankyrin repeat protein